MPDRHSLLRELFHDPFLALSTAITGYLLRLPRGAPGFWLAVIFGAALAGGLVTAYFLKISRSLAKVSPDTSCGTNACP